MTTQTHNSISSHARRGSAILIVVGTLALIAVFAAIYISVGQSDQRVANSISNRNKIDANADIIANHILGILGSDRLDFTVQHIDDGSAVFFTPEVTDAPYTGWDMRSESDDEWERFNPSGRHWLQGNSASTDYRVASDPWLASTTPTFLGDPGQPISGDDLRPFGSLLTQGWSGDPEVFIADAYSSSFLDNRDWLQISNLAPDGRFVNLFNLRENTLTPARNNGFNDPSVGGFDSEPGTGAFTRESDGRTVRRMSEYLSLWNQEQPGVSSSRIRAFDPEDVGVWLPGRNTPADIGPDVANIPAVWTMYQRFALLPIDQPFLTVNRHDQISTWADPDFINYQWADADGNGMADSRWFELASAQDTQSGSNLPRTDVERLYDSGQSRIFVAARVMDLSSVVNVNTASDQLDKPEPELGAPMGFTPGEVDLRRLLTMQDASENSSISISGNGSLAPANYHRGRGARNNPAGNFPEQIRDDDYRFYRSVVLDAADPADPPEMQPHSTSLSIGRYAYDSIKRGMLEGNTLDDRYFAWPPEFQPDFGDPVAPLTTADFDSVFNSPEPITNAPYYNVNSLFRLSQQFFQSPPVSPMPGALIEQAEQRKWLYENYGALDPNRPFMQGVQTEADSVALYNNDDLLELLSFWGLNDPGTTSRLEKAAMGRMPSILQKNQRAFTPLLSNRPLAIDRKQHGFVDEDGYVNSYMIADPRDKRAIVGGIAKESMAFLATSPRQFLTTINGATHLKPGSFVNSVSPTLVGQSAPTLQSVLSSPTQLFNLYADALAGELNTWKVPGGAIDDLFELDPAQSRTNETATLFYGHRGPELALRTAAHMAANMKDLNDSDTTPTVLTLLMDNSRRDDFGITNFPEDLQPSNDWYRDYPGVADGNLLDLGDNRLPGTEGGGSHITDEHRQAINIYGIEPMPVLTETVSFYVFHDASQSGANGDDDFSPFRPARTGGTPPALPLPGTQRKITIDPNPDSTSNSDCLVQGIAFQLHNPWDAPISLGGNGKNTNAPLTRQRDPDDNSVIDTTANFEFDYYIEWNGYFFKLAEYTRYYPPSSSAFDYRNEDSDDLGVSNPGLDFPETVANDPNNGLVLDPAVYPDYIARNVVLQPGDTRVFYAIADPRFDVGNSELVLDTKWRAALAAYGELPVEFSAGGIDFDSDGLIDGADRRGWTGPAKEWIQNQFGSNTQTPSVQIHPMNPQTGEYANEDYQSYLNTPLDHSNPTGFTGSFTQLASAANREDSGEVRLWRKIVTTAEETTDNTSDGLTNSTTENLLHNDMLVDRMSLESGVAEPFDLAGNELPKSASFPEGYPNTPSEVAAAVRNDNTGYTLVQWASTSRRDWVDGALGDIATPAEPGVSQVREWILSSRLSPASSLVSATDRHIEFNSENDSAFTNEDFIDGGGKDLDNVTEPRGLIINGNVEARSDYETHRTLGDMYGHFRPILLTAALEPYRKSELEFLAPDNGDLGSEVKFNRDLTNAQWFNPSGASLHEDDDTNPDNLRPELLTSAQGFNGAPRLADLLMAWGIGPAFAPSQAGSLGTAAPSYFSQEWMTFTEALAIALGYEDPAPASLSADNIWAGTHAAGDEFFDNGHLALDKYVAYYNIDTSEVIPEFDTLTDIRRGTGIPMALGVLDQARPLESKDTTADQLTTPTYGLVNINTAPVEVLRLLPGLSPSRTGYYQDNTNASSITDEWWANEFSELDLPDLSEPFNPTSPELRTPDVASLLIAYRDRLQADPRVSSRLASFVGEDNPLRYSTDTSFADIHADNLVTEQSASEQGQLLDFRDRASISGVNGLRQTPGFGSMGEVLMATIDPSIQGQSSVLVSTLYSQLDIQQYGSDELPLDGGSDFARTAIDPQLFNGNSNGDTVDDYAERLAMANGILNTISVRSDYYAVWFVIHVYQESDVSNLLPEDPLIPSIAKRYVMVVDRTNVVDPGDTPKIIFLKEVPM